MYAPLFPFNLITTENKKLRTCLKNNKKEEKHYFILLKYIGIQLHVL